MHSPKNEIDSKIGDENAQESDNAENVKIHRLANPFNTSRVQTKGIYEHCNQCPYLLGIPSRDFNATGEFLLTTPKNWQFSTDLGYNFYRGYSAGYGEPELIWNAGIAKDIKAFTLSLKCADILGQQKSLHRTTSAEYVEDIRRNVMGRYFLVGLVFNFGRMNASQSSKVERAMWDMAF